MDDPPGVESIDVSSLDDSPDDPTVAVCGPVKCNMLTKEIGCMSSKLKPKH